MALSRRKQRAQSFAVGRIEEAHAELAFELVVAYAPACLTKAQGHRRERRRGLREGNFRRRIAAKKLRGENDRVAGRARLIVGDVENSRGFACECRVDRLRDVGDMDAVENLAGLEDAPGIAARDLQERVAAGPVDA